MNFIRLGLIAVVLATVSTQTPAIPTCTVATSAMLSFGSIVALDSTGDVTTNSGSSFWINCTGDAIAVPSLYSTTPRTLISGGSSLPFVLSAITPGGIELPSASPGVSLRIVQNGTNQNVALYGRVYSSSFRSLPAGRYTRSVVLTVEY